MTKFAFKQFLGRKIMAAVTLGILLIMGAEIMFRGYFGIKDRVALMETMSADLAASTYSGIRYPMSVGDSDAVERVLADMRLKMEGVEVFVCDTSQRIIWSTHEEKIHTGIAESIFNAAALADLDEALRSGKAPRTSHEDYLQAKRHLITIQPILNEKECFHCHGSSNKVVGGMVIRTDMQRIMAAVKAAANRSILIMILGIAAIITLVYVLIENIIRKPLAGLSQGVQRIGAGELDFEIQADTPDEFGELARSFNQMTKELKSAREEINTWTNTLEDLVENRTVQLKRAMESAVQSEKMASLGRLSAIMAHEINNPLAGIRTYAKLLLKKGDAISACTDPRFVQYLQTIESESARCGEIVRNLLQFARPDKPHFGLQDANTIIIECLQLVQHKMKLQDIDARLELTAEPVTVNCDGQKIKQAILALLLNACDAVEPGSGVIEIRSQLLVERQGVLISIKDNGIGMDNETKAHMFEPFFTTKVSSQDHGATLNIGLGLTVVYEIVHSHQGEISVDSELGKGSAISIFLPKEPGAENQ